MTILGNVSMSPYSTFGVEARARAFATLASEEEIDEAAAFLRDSERTLILGGGSNLLFVEDFVGAVLKIETKGIIVAEESEDFVTLEIAAGEVWNDVVRYAVDRNWGGVENLALIPGTAGAAPIQNIGAYGAELQDVFVDARGIMIRTGERRVLSKEECRFGYRDGVFKRELRGEFVIVAIRLRLRKNPKPEELRVNYAALQAELSAVSSDLCVRDIAAAVSRVRQRKLPDPALLGNAGSFFKNPEIPAQLAESLRGEFPDIPVFSSSGGKAKLSAGWLIERCGWKGKRVGNVGSYAKQALVLVNYGGATGAEVLKYAADVRDSVRERFGVTLETEVNIIGGTQSA